MSLEVRRLRRSQLSNFYNQKPKLRLRTHRKHKKQERSTTVSKIQSLEEACLCVHLITLALYLLPSDLDRNSSAPVVSVTLHIQYCVTRSLSRYTLTFSTLSSLRLLWYWQGEFIWQLKVSKINDFLFFFMTSSFDPRVIPQGEVRSQSRSLQWEKSGLAIFL